MRCLSSFLRCRLLVSLLVLTTIAVTHMSVFVSSFHLVGDSDLIEVDCGFPELVVRLVEVSHADLSKVTGVVLVDVRSVMVLATSHTATTWMLPVLAYTTVAGGDMAATRREEMSVLCPCAIPSSLYYKRTTPENLRLVFRDTHCFLVLVNRVGILTV